jgi:tetratricopeptide (TPR) repeat protein
MLRPGAALTDELGWEPPLRFRRGAPERLRGIAVFYDFRWRDYFSDNRVQFQNGKRLADQVIKDCPSGLRPALLLTANDDAEEGAISTDRYYVMVVNLPSYLELAEADAAAAYLAQRLGAGLTRAKRFSDVSEADPRELARWLGGRLDAEVLGRWAAENQERIDLLRAVADQAEGASDTETATDVERAVKALEVLRALDPEVAQAVGELATTEADPEARLELLRALTHDIDGRYATAEVLGERAYDRLGDARGAAEEFEELLATAGETEIQAFLEIQPWLLGLDYVQVRARQPIPRGAVDFLLERFDGFHDLLELKSPNDSVFEVQSRQAIPSPSAYRLSRQLALALAQVHAYKDALRFEDAVEKLYGLPHTREPHSIILIGRASELTDGEERLLRELNRSLHRVEVVPFDVLARRATVVLDNVETYLVAVDEAPDTD